MARSDLYVDQLVKNAELKNLAEYAHKCSWNTAREQSGGQQAGLDEHALNRQATWIKNARERLAVVQSQPEPDQPASHPNDLPVVLPEPTFLTSDNRPVNPDCEAVAIMWQTIAYELAKSASSKKGGSMTQADAKRCEVNINALEQFLVAVAAASELDFPESAADVG